ncbi:MAG: DMT family transporter [Rhodobiaceae bacterium]|nr:DMT family transporter [Rhodobiaceae bacterium]MCC0053723.1 DMT family transporter [Rhodobiaceae bacterium]
MQGEAAKAGQGPGLVDYALLLALSLIWGSSFMFMKVAVAGIAPASISFLRALLGATIMIPIALAVGHRLPLGWRIAGLMVLAGLFGNAMPFTLIAWGQRHIDSGLAAITMGAMPLYTLVLAHLFTDDEKFNRVKLAGVLFGFVGIIVLIGPEKLLLMGDATVGQLAVAGGGLCYATNAIVTKRITGLPRYATVASVLSASVAMMFPVASASDFGLQPLSVFRDASWLSVGAVVVMGIVQTALATVLMFQLIGRAGATFFSQLNFLVPLFGVVLGALVLGERPGVNAWVALALIFTGIAVARRGQRQ